MHSGNQREASSKPTLSEDEQEALEGPKQGGIQGTTDGSRIETVSVGSPRLMELPFSAGSKMHSRGPVTEAASPRESEFKGAGPPEDQTDLNGCKPDEERASDGRSKFALLANSEDEPEQVPAEMLKAHSNASSGEAVEPPVEKDSPESPFEVIADKLEFDKEFRDVVSSSSKDIGSNWVIHGEREQLTDIPEDRICEFQAKPRSSGRLPSGPGLSRQSSGTTAALEEVSKCVREMHSFTNELLNWDLIPKDLEGKTDDVISSGFKASPTEKSGGVPEPTVSPSGQEASKASAPHQPVTISLHQKGKPSLQVDQKQATVGQGVAVVKSAPPEAVPMKAEPSWPNPCLPETADADSSGESDDTVIEDAPAALAFPNKAVVENCQSFSKVTSSSEAEIVYIDEEEEEASDELLEDQVALESRWRFTDEFKATQAEPHAARQRPSAASGEPGLSAPPKAKRVSDAGELEVPKKTAKAGGLLRNTPLDSVRGAVCPDGLGTESFMDFVKECLNSKGAESTEEAVEMFSEAELKAARSQQPPQAKQDFEQERLTITALREAGRKAETERPTRFSPPRGRPSGQYSEVPPEATASAPKSALEKRPLCLEQAVDVTLVPASVGLGKTSRPLPPEASVLHTVTKLLAEFSGNPTGR